MKHTLPADFPAPDYLRTGDSEHWPFSHVPYKYGWKLRHKIAYALHLRLSIVEAEKLYWGYAFEHAYERVCACISYRFSSDWQEKHWPDYAKMQKAFARNRRILGYAEMPSQ